MVNALESKNKLGFMNGKISKPDTLSPEFDAWEKCDSMVVAWLYNVIDKKLHGSVAYAKTAQQMSNDLEERYSQSNSVGIHQIKRDINLLQQGDLTVTEYFTKMKTL